MKPASLFDVDPDFVIFKVFAASAFLADGMLMFPGQTVTVRLSVARRASERAGECFVPDDVQARFLGTYEVG